jgi:hypothetical protein
MALLLLCAQRLSVFRCLCCFLTLLQLTQMLWRQSLLVKMVLIPTSTCSIMTCFPRDVLVLYYFAFFRSYYCPGCFAVSAFWRFFSCASRYVMTWCLFLLLFSDRDVAFLAFALRWRIPFHVFSASARFFWCICQVSCSYLRSFSVKFLPLSCRRC